jgi:hypothetical protein
MNSSLENGMSRRFDVRPVLKDAILASGLCAQSIVRARLFYALAPHHCLIEECCNILFSNQTTNA